MVRIDRVDIFELYEDRAIQALRVLHRLAAASDVREGFEIEELLVEGGEGTRRASFEEADGWWRRVRITVEDDGSFKFEVATDRAQAPRYLRPDAAGAGRPAPGTCQPMDRRRRGAGLHPVRAHAALRA